MKNIIIAVIGMTILIANAEARRDQKRESIQQSRIQQGVQSGSLTRKEVKKLRKGQKHIDNLQNKAKADGDVTAKEKLRIEKAQNRQSKMISKQKHDGQNRKNPNEVVPSVPAEESKN